MPGVTFQALVALSTGFPRLVQTDSNTATSSATCAVTYTGTVAAGELIFFISAVRNTGAVTISSGPSGFTQLATSTPAANMTRVCIYYKVAVGGETSASITYSSATSNIAAVTARYTNRQGNPEAGTTQTANSATAAWNAVTPSWGLANTKYFAVVFSNNDVLGSAPSNYTLVKSASNAGDSVRVTLYDRDLAATSDDPPDASVAAAVWATYAMALRPV